MEDSAKPRDLEDRTAKALGAKLTKGSSRFTIALGVRARPRATFRELFFAEGAISTCSLGQRPRKRNMKHFLALKARFTPARVES
jgi:hypothetical protein